MFRSYRLLWEMLTRRERRQFAQVIGLTLLMGLFEVASVAGILPFMAVLARPEVATTQPFIMAFADFLGLTTPREVTVALGVLVFAVILVGMAVRAIVTYRQLHFCMMRGAALAGRLLKGYLAQPYVWFLSRNTAEFGQMILSETDVVMRESILPSVVLLSNIVVTVMISLVIFAVQPWVAVGATGVLCLVYFVVFRLLRNPLDRISKRRVQANRHLFQIVHEVMGGIKEVKVMGLEAGSFARFEPHSHILARQQTLGQVVSKLPRFALEAVVYGGFILMVLILMLVRGDDITTLLPLLGLIGMAGTKLFPSLQQIFVQVSALRGSQASLAKLHEALLSLPEVTEPGPEPEALPVRHGIELRDLHFRYPGAEEDTLAGLSAQIPARSSLGIVGGTGAGKTSLVDIVLGLLTPATGAVYVDGIAVTADRLRAWQKGIGYVPQQIFLTDNTVAANIAYGIAPDDIDMDAVERATRTANLHEFVTNELPQGYQTIVGERGVRLSGGQRQRIGIARALYHDPEVLILDEATSALDNTTERAVMEAMQALGHKKTILMIAHRLSTVQACDKILMLDQGRIAAEGTYQQLLDTHEGFRRMVFGASAGPQAVIEGGGDGAPARPDRPARAAP